MPYAACTRGFDVGFKKHKLINKGENYAVAKTEGD